MAGVTMAIKLKVEKEWLGLTVGELISFAQALNKANASWDAVLDIRQAGGGGCFPASISYDSTNVED